MIIYKHPSAHFVLHRLWCKTFALDVLHSTIYSKTSNGRRPFCWNDRIWWKKRRRKRRGYVHTLAFWRIKTSSINQCADIRYSRESKCYFTISNLRRNNNNNKKKILGQCSCSCNQCLDQMTYYSPAQSTHMVEMVSSDILNCRSSFFKWDNDIDYNRFFFLARACVYAFFFFCSSAISIAVFYCIVFHLLLALGSEGFGVLSLVRVWGIFYALNSSFYLQCLRCCRMSSLCFSFIWRVIYLTTFPIAIGSYSVFAP